LVGLICSNPTILHLHAGYPVLVSTTAVKGMEKINQKEIDRENKREVGEKETSRRKGTRLGVKDIQKKNKEYQYYTTSILLNFNKSLTCYSFGLKRIQNCIKVRYTKLH